MSEFNELLEELKCSFVKKRLSAEEFNNLTTIFETKQFNLDKKHKYSHSDVRFYNKFYGEVKPLNILASNLAKNNKVDIEMTQDGEQFDATLYINNNKAQKAECTQADDGQQRELQLESLNKLGCAPAHDEVETNGKSKASGEREILKTPSKARELSEGKEILLNLIVDRLNKKIRKNNKDYKHAWLLIAFPKLSYKFLDDDSIKKICDKAYSQSICHHTIFEKIYFIGYTESWGESFLYSI